MPSIVTTFSRMTTFQRIRLNHQVIVTYSVCREFHRRVDAFSAIISAPWAWLQVCVGPSITPPGASLPFFTALQIKPRVLRLCRISMFCVCVFNFTHSPCSAQIADCISNFGRTWLLRVRRGVLAPSVGHRPLRRWRVRAHICEGFE